MVNQHRDVFFLLVELLFSGNGSLAMQANSVINRNDCIKKEALPLPLLRGNENGVWGLSEKLPLNFMNLGSNGTLETPFMY